MFNPKNKSYYMNFNIKIRVIEALITDITSVKFMLYG